MWIPGDETSYGITVVGKSNLVCHQTSMNDRSWGKLQIQLKSKHQITTMMMKPITHTNCSIILWKIQKYILKSDLTKQHQNFDCNACIVNNEHGKPLQSSSMGVDIFFSLIRSYFWRFVAAFKPCHGKLPRRKYINT